MNSNDTTSNKSHTEDQARLMIMRFISENIIVDRFPVLNELRSQGKHQDCQVIINVSDEFYLANSEKIMHQGKLNYYFPMGELGASMGLNSIYGALQVLHCIYTDYPSWKVLLHCQAGLNRSPTIKASFYYMMLGEHIAVGESCGGHQHGNQLIHNCDDKHLPTIDKMELFLSKCKFAFDHSESFLGGMFDWVISESGC